MSELSAFDESFVLLVVGGFLFVVGTGCERLSAYIKNRGKTPRYIGCNKLKSIENLRRFLSSKRAELDRAESEAIILFENDQGRLVEKLRQFAAAPDNSRFPIRLVEVNSPIVDVRDTSSGERIGSTEYPPAILEAKSWVMDYDNLIMSLEEDAKQQIKYKTKVFNYAGYSLIITGTLVMAYASWLV